MGLILALDTDEYTHASFVLKQVQDYLSCVKISHVLLANTPADLLDELLGDLPLFLDLKWHDIPNTVDLAIRAYQRRFTNLRYFTFHGSGSDEMIKTAAQFPEQALSVISLSSETIEAQDFIAKAERNFNLGIRGFICPGTFLGIMRENLGRDITLITPGVRNDVPINDHQLVISSAQAKIRGATHIVVGRPILNGAFPAQIAQTYL